MNLSWSRKIALRHFVITSALCAMMFITLFVMNYQNDTKRFVREAEHQAKFFAQLYKRDQNNPLVVHDTKVEGLWITIDQSLVQNFGNLPRKLALEKKTVPYVFYASYEEIVEEKFVLVEYAFIPQNYDPYEKLPVFLLHSLLMMVIFFLVLQYFHRQFFDGIHALENLEEHQIQKNEIQAILNQNIMPNFAPIGISIMKIVDKYHESQLQLRDGNDTLNLAMWAAESGYWEWDLQRNEFHLSQGAKLLLEVPMNDEGELEKKSILSYVHPSQQHLIQSVLKKNQHHKNHELSFELLMLKNGHYEWFEVKGKISERNSLGQGTKISGLLRNIQSQKNLNADLVMFKNAFESIAESVMIINQEKKITHVNKSFEQTTGYQKNEIVGQPLSVLYSDKHENAFYKQIFLDIFKEGGWSGELWMQRSDKSAFPEWLSMYGILDPHGSIEYYIGIFTDLTQRKRQDDTLKFLSNFDPLTSLANKNQFLVTLSKTLQEHSKRKHEFCLVIICINDLNKINEVYGHMLTDYAIRLVSERLKNHAYSSDLLARIGGDEFAVIIEHHQLNHKDKIISDIQKAISAPMNIENSEEIISCSIGYTLYPRDGETSSQIMKNAHSASIYSRQKATNTLKEYDSEIDRKNNERKKLEEYLRKALAHNELKIYYQPKVCLHTNKIIGSEALVRWHHEKLGFVSPAVFVPLAEETGLINLLGEWVLHEACRQNLRWNEMGFKDLVVGVNLSAGQFKTGDFAHLVAQALWDIGLDPKLLELELTESLVMDEPEKCKLMLLVLKKMGVKISIDDFGTGYSSLSHIREFPIDTLKIDKSFIQDLLVEEEAISIIRAIIAMAKSLQLNVIAEGVEHEAQADLVHKLGCDSIQGFYVAKALPVDEFTALLSKYNRVS